MNKKQIERIDRAVALLRKVDEELCQKSNRGKMSRDEQSQARILYSGILHLESAVNDIKSWEK